MSLNKVFEIGNLTRDVEMRQTQSGMSVGSFTVAVNNRRKSKQTGEWEDVPCFIPCTIFGKRAEALAQYLVKGQKVGIDGKLDFSQWETDAGEKRSMLKVIVDDLELLGGSRQHEQSEQVREIPAEETADLPF